MMLRNKLKVLSNKRKLRYILLYNLVVEMFMIQLNHTDLITLCNMKVKMKKKKTDQPCECMVNPELFNI